MFEADYGLTSIDLVVQVVLLLVSIIAAWSVGAMGLGQRSRDAGRFTERRPSR